MSAHFAIQLDLCRHIIMQWLSFFKDLVKYGIVLSKYNSTKFVNDVLQRNLASVM